MIFVGDLNKTIGFELTIVDKDTSRHWCFSFILDNPQWEEKDRHESVTISFCTCESIFMILTLKRREFKNLNFY